MHRSHLSLAFLLGLIVGIGVLQWWQHPVYPAALWWIFGCPIGISILMALWKKQAAIVAAMLIGILAALWSVQRTTHVPQASTVDTYATGARVTLTGIISDEPDRRPLKTQYTVAVTTLTQSGATRAVHGKILVTDMDGWPQYHYGEELKIGGKLETPKPSESFAYDKYLSRFDIYAVMIRPSIALVREPARPSFFRVLYAWKERFERQINLLQPEPHASFLAGLLTGSRRGIPDHLTTDFNATGLTHIIAISGTNITMIVLCLGSFLFWLPLRWRFVPMVAGIVLFTLFVGASASVVRAAVMGILGLIALQTRRQTDTRLLILWAAGFMLAWNPKLLWYDAGFQLSFLAVIGLNECTPLIAPLLKNIPDTLGMRENLQATTAAQIATLPWIALLFGRISLVAPLANLLVTPLIPAAMLFGFLGVCLSWLWFPLGLVVSYLAFGCMEWMIRMTELMAHVPFASIDVKGLPWWSVAGAYGGIVILILRQNRAGHGPNKPINQ